MVSAAALCFEVNLTRLFSVSQFYHFAFMVVSIAVLGFGASGSYLALRKTVPGRLESRALPWLAGGAGLSMLAAYLLVNWVPFDSFRIALQPSQILLLLAQYAVLAIPFLFCGMIIGLMLRQHHRQSGEVYALNLFGSALGCLAAILLPGWVDGEGVVLVSGIFALMGGLLFCLQGGRAGSIINRDRRRVRLFLAGGNLGLFLLIGIRLVSGRYPGTVEMTLSPYKSLSYALQPPQAVLVSSRWNSFSRVDLVRSPSLHALPGLSYRYPGEVPEILGLFIDGDNLNPVLPAESGRDWAGYLPGAIAYQLRPEAKTLILEPKGGLEVEASLALGAAQVTAVEANPLVIAASPGAYQQTGVQLIESSGRSYLHSIRGAYDIIQMPLTDSYHPVSSGAYALGEDYRYTVEAFEDLVLALKPDGMLVITRWLQEDPTEWLRTFALAVTALEAQGLDPHDRVVALRSYNTGTLLLKPTPFRGDELALIRAFAEDRAFDLVFGPGVTPEDLNRFNVLPEPTYNLTFQRLLGSDPRSAFYQEYPFDVRPPTDNHPFFGHYFKWSQIDEILAEFGITWQPFGGAGYLVILILLGLALTLSTGLILLPLIALRKSIPGNPPLPAPVYFGLIGLGFMLVEIPLIQQLILYLDQPTYAFAGVLFGILFFSGMGSRFGARRIPLTIALPGLLGFLGLYALLLSPVISATLGLKLIHRLGLAGLMLAPVGFLLGIPFPAGLAWWGQQPGGVGPANRQWIAWMWGVNGAASVTASILASLVSLSLGFTQTLIIGVVLYGLAWGILLVTSKKRSATPAP